MSIPISELKEKGSLSNFCNFNCMTSSVLKHPFHSKSRYSTGSGLCKTVMGGYSKMTKNVCQTSSTECPGSIPVNEIVYAWHSSRHIWHSASIIHTRHRMDNDGIDSQRVARPIAESSFSSGTKSSHTMQPSSLVNMFDSNTDEIKNAKDRVTIHSHYWMGKESLYDYYVHFHGEDRRYDTWISIELLRPYNFQFSSEDSFLNIPPGLDEIHKNMDIDYLREHEEKTKFKSITNVCIGDYVLNTWYFSPYPKEYQNIAQLYICQFCLSFFKYQCELEYHSCICNLRHPPGNEIYRDSEKQLAIFEVDGSTAKAYSENLCYLSKLFLDHKTLQHPVFLFLFYILTEIVEEGNSIECSYWFEDVITDLGNKIVGYFSKEKFSKNNLSCIMCLPPDMEDCLSICRMHFHTLKAEGVYISQNDYLIVVIGTPERPLSDLGLASYIKYWSNVVLSALLSSNTCSISLEDLAIITSIETLDIALALETVGILQFAEDTGSPYIILPDEYRMYMEKYSKPVFTDYIVDFDISSNLDHIATLDNMPLRNDETSNNLVETIQKSFIKKPLKTEQGSIPSLSMNTYSKKCRRTNSRQCVTSKNLKNIHKSKKIKPNNKDHIETVSVNEQSESIAKSMNSQSINLAWLRWEPYDFHMESYEKSLSNKITRNSINVMTS